MQIYKYKSNLPTDIENFIYNTAKLVQKNDINVKQSLCQWHLPNFLLIRLRRIVVADCRLLQDCGCRARLFSDFIASLHFLSVAECISGGKIYAWVCCCADDSLSLVHQLYDL